MRSSIVVSVIIPTYNSEKYVQKCLDSVIMQTLNNIEIIIIDNISVDNTVEVAKDYLFQDVIYRSENQPLPEMAMDVPEAGQYFVRVRAGNKSGYTQDAFDYYVTDSGKNYGMKCFYVTEDNQIEEDTYDEK